MASQLKDYQDSCILCEEVMRYETGEDDEGAALLSSEYGIGEKVHSERDKDIQDFE